MANKSYKLTKEDAMEILASVIGELQGVGFRVGYKNAGANERRQEGLLVFIEGIKTDGDQLLLVGNKAEKDNKQ